MNEIDQAAIDALMLCIGSIESSLTVLEIVVHGADGDPVAQAFAASEAPLALEDIRQAVQAIKCGSLPLIEKSAIQKIA